MRTTWAWGEVVGGKEECGYMSSLAIGKINELNDLLEPFNDTCPFSRSGG